jgi:NAD(P)-dependent dehydrogenase (short-subunit alcohol dehydrogenase family)
MTVTVVTGASSGIGRSLARRLAVGKLKGHPPT